ncbi:MAG: threonine aldolase [Abditibacteriota bacterium]|nr:threonine aldolase [Abditibacteriota bacterium]
MNTFAEPIYFFASDNTCGLCPPAWDALRIAGEGFCPSYGEDIWTRDACDALRDTFETECDVYFVFNGTAANSLALATLCQSYHSVIAHESAHIETDECGAPEFFSNGTKLLLARGERGKMEPESVERLITRRSDLHFPKPRVLSLTQPTEMGVIYQPAELKELSDLAHHRGLKVHMDGARFANAVASLQVAPREISWQAGVDVLCFGGIKLGMGLGEAVVFFDRDLSAEFSFRCKQAGQLASKMRFLSAPWSAGLRDGWWLENARQANACAQALAKGIKAATGIAPLYPVEANAVFLDLPQQLQNKLRERGWVFYSFIGGGARFMCSWATTEEQIAALINDISNIQA